METWIYELKPYLLLIVGVTALNLSSSSTGMAWAFALIGLTISIIYRRIDHRIATNRV